MKNMPKINQFLGCCMLVSILMFSCQSEELQDNQIPENTQSLSLEKLTSVNKTAMAASAMREAYVDCETSCIVAGSGDYFVMADSDFHEQGNGNGYKKKEVSYEAYNTETQFIIDVYYQYIGNANFNSSIEVEITNVNINGEPQVVNISPVIQDNLEGGEIVSLIYNLPMDWEACDEISFSIKQEGLSDDLTLDATYSLIGICPCEESFSYEAIGENSYLFTYSSVDALEDAVVQFTCPHIVDFTPLDDKEYSVNPGNGQGSPTVLTWVGDLEACAETTFAIVFDADCDQNNANFANIFTDFKVNGDSKKGDVSNIKFDCTE
ncbi:hypothetical protein [Mangrovimonas sp. YM274]|uniref:hypothetical protein n=1 Tax=Mangrovimonas sp. YM274 TaxID=3070660 RepID=UPI0027DD1A4B|nr:hypothetical protein [Mangrovimonas sp. YM274]WMI69997.1 hypothetical protein RBH95_06510 [Mangrovimonas sp. YM274]